MLQMRTLAPVKRTETPMPDPQKILRDLETLTNTIDFDRTDLAKLEMAPEMRKSIRQHVGRCLHSLRELEFVLEGQERPDDSEADFPI